MKTPHEISNEIVQEILGMFRPKDQKSLALHWTDGEGRPIPGAPITTAEACEAGIALFE